MGKHKTETWRTAVKRIVDEQVRAIGDGHCLPTADETRRNLELLAIVTRSYRNCRYSIGKLNPCDGNIYTGSARFGKVRACPCNAWRER